MQYRINLAEADTINMNNRCYSKECLEQLKNQINEKAIVVTDESSEGKMIPNKSIGKTIKAEIIDNCLYVDVTLIKQTSAKFINLSICGRIERDNTVKKLWNGDKASGIQFLNDDVIQYITNHDEIKEPKINFLFASNTNSYSKDNFKTSNFVKKQTIFNNE